MNFDILSAILGVISGAGGASVFWVLKYNNIRFDLGLERDMHERTQSALSAERNLTEGLAMTLNENMPLAGMKTTRKTKK